MKINNAMKPIYYFVAFFCCAFLLVACESHNQTSYAGDTEPSIHVCIVKFTAPNYKDSVVVEKDDEGDSCQIRKIGGYGTCQELFLGTSPYLALPDGYYLVDLKWGDFFYYNFFINVNWKEVKDRMQKWEYPPENVNKHFVSDLRKISCRAIDKYFGEQFGNRNYVIPNLSYHTISDVPSFELQNFYKEVAIQDSLQDVYLERLSQIINDSALDRVRHKYQYNY